MPEPWGRQLQDYRVRLGDLAAIQIPTHITLLAPLEVAPAEIGGIIRHLQVAAGQSDSIKVHLRGTGTFRPVSPVVFINVATGISQLERLSQAVRQGPLAVESKFLYHPHVTVAHEVSEEMLDQAYTELASFEAEFEATHCWLYLHDDESGWQPERSFALGRRLNGD